MYFFDVIFPKKHHSTKSKLDFIKIFEIKKKTQNEKKHSVDYRVLC
jgi:hypothetical protein